MSQGSFAQAGVGAMRFLSVALWAGLDVEN